ARLTVIGSRAVDRLIALATSEAAPADARAAAWRALDAIGDARALEPALQALAPASTPAPIAAAAASIARAFIKGPEGAAAVDRLTAVVLDRARPEAVRRAALGALNALDRRTLAPLVKSLAGDPILRAPSGRAQTASPRARTARGGLSRADS